MDLIAQYSEDRSGAQRLHEGDESDGASVGEELRVVLPDVSAAPMVRHVCSCRHGLLQSVAQFRFHPCLEKCKWESVGGCLKILPRAD